MVTETKTATLEDVLNEGLTSGEEVSKDTEVEEAPEDKVKTEEPEVEAEETAKEDALTPENFDSRVQSEVDKKTNTYRERREADSAYIRSLQTKVKELSVDSSTKHLSKLMDAIVEGDQEEGIEPDKIEAKKESFKEIKKLFKVYDENTTKVNEAVEFIDVMTGQLSDKIIDKFGLDDANPAIRAANGAQLVSDAIFYMKQKSDFLLTLENFLPKGDELRTKFEAILKELAECGTEREKKLYLEKEMRGVKVSRKKLPSPSVPTGGGNELKGEEALVAALEEEQKILRR